MTKELLNDDQKLESCNISSKMSFWTFRRQPKDKLSNICKQISKGTFKKPVDTVLTYFLSFPLVTVKDSKIYHEIGKVDGKGIGTLKLSLSIERESSKNKSSDNDGMCSLILVLGSFEKGKLLASKEIPLASSYQKGGGLWTGELNFDWKTANVYGGLDGGHVILRLLLDSVRGLDSEVVIPLT